jgi:hypothetical protein
VYRVRSGAAKYKLSFALSALTARTLAGCAVIGSAPTFDESAGSLGCRSTLGSYSLPKTVLNFVITKATDQPYHVLQGVNFVRVPDNQHTFCLDHLRSPLASDEVRVFKNRITTTESDSATIKSPAGVVLGKKRTVSSVAQTSTPFLQLIASKAVDHTAGIIRRFIRTAFVLLTNKGGFNPGRSAVGTGTGSAIVVADFTVDPFDHQEMARVNDVVRKFGFCFVLEDYTFDRSQGSGASADRYCRAPGVTAAEMPPRAAAAIQELHYLAPKPTTGIFYRPRASYRLSIYLNDDPGGRGRWRLGQIKNFTMENIMPIVSVGVDRAIFATRRTGLVFLDGALTNVCVSKGSEVESAIQIPLDVVYGIISLPSEMILAAVNDATTANSLLTAQRNLISAQNSYIKFLNNPSATALSGAPAAGTGKGPLTLGSTAVPVTGNGSDTFTEDDSADAGPIYTTDGDALSEICAELSVTSTMNPSPTNPSTSTAGAF